MKGSKKWIPFAIMGGIVVVALLAAVISGAVIIHNSVSREEKVAENSKKERVKEDSDKPDSDGKNKDSKENTEDTDQQDQPSEQEQDYAELREAALKNQYAGFVDALRFTTNKWVDETDIEEHSLDNTAENQFAIYDVDLDGKEELVVMFTTASMVGMCGEVFDFDQENGMLVSELREFPSYTFYTNGMIKVDWSHNQTRGELYPYTIYRYDESKDQYVQAGAAYSENKEYAGDDFNEASDTDHDGVIYYVSREDSENSTPMTEEEYNNWLKEMFGDATEVELPYEPVTAENSDKYKDAYMQVLKNYTNKYLKTDQTDLGNIWILDGQEAAVDTLKSLQGVEIQEHDDFVNVEYGEEGMLDYGIDDGGWFDYRNEALDGISFFGIRPGMTEQEAEEQLARYCIWKEGPQTSGSGDKAYCSGRGSVNICVWLNVENGVVKRIDFAPRNHYAG